MNPRVPGSPARQIRAWRAPSSSCSTSTDAELNEVLNTMVSFLKTHWRLSMAPVLLGAGLILFALIIFTSTPSAAKPAVTWTPSSVTQIILPGGTDTISVSFTASKNLTNVTIRVVPEVEPFVDVTPSSFLAVAKGETKTLQLALSAPIADPLLGSFVRKGTIHLQRGTTTLARPLSISMFGLPPDPGAPGEATLEGIDSDGDGVRDDIQRFITLTHSDSARTRAALTQYAAETLQALLDAESTGDSIEHARSIGAAISCLWYLHSDDAPDVRADILAEILNTVERNRAYLTHDAQLSGQVFPVTPFDQRKVSCAFDVDELPN